MKYFILRPDKQFSDGPVIKKMPLERKQICKEYFHKIPDRQIVPMVTMETTLFPDLLAAPIYLISEKIMSVVQMYGDIILKRDLILIDSQIKAMKRYFVVLFEVVPCELAAQTEKGLRILSVQSEGIPLKERNIFEIQLEGRRELIINLDFAESILRRNVLGIHLEAVKVCENEKAGG